MVFSRLSSSARVVCLLCLTSCGGQVVAIKLPKYDPNPNAFYVCEPSSGGASFDCRSERAFHQYDRELVVGTERCDYGVASIYVETNSHGKVTRVQYQCAVAEVEDFPNSASSTPATPGRP